VQALAQTIAGLTSTTPRRAPLSEAAAKAAKARVTKVLIVLPLLGQRGLPSRGFMVQCNKLCNCEE